VADKPVRYPPGMDARSTRVAAVLNTPMLIAAALTLPTVAITESHPGGALQTVAIALNWATWTALLVELVVMLAVVPDRRAWIATTRSTSSSSSSPRRCCRPGCRA
jgi:hypothetical protein